MHIIHIAKCCRCVHCDHCGSTWRLQSACKLLANLTSTSLNIPLRNEKEALKHHNEQKSKGGGYGVQCSFVGMVTGGGGGGGQKVTCSGPKVTCARLKSDVWARMQHWSVIIVGLRMVIRILCEVTARTRG